MSKKESLVEDTFIQIKNLENAINENAKGILASTMKEEISSLVKESLKEQEDEGIEDADEDAEEVDFDADNMDMDFKDEESDDETDMDMDMDVDMDFEDEESDDEMDMDMDSTIDLTNASDEEILRVFKAMNDEDGIIVKKDDEMLHLSDENEDVEYLIRLGESEEDEDEDEQLPEPEVGMEDEEEEEEVIYELELDIDDEDEDEEYDLPSVGDDYFEMDEYVTESSKFKAKGLGMGNASKFKYGKKPNQGEGFKTKMKQGTRGVGMGKAKFEYKEEVNSKLVDKKKPVVKKAETKEASRTLGSGKRWGKKGLDKPKSAPRHLRVESTDKELTLLREKNEEYRKALNLFRTKLNEVAVFNSNLAYATRLFTEHSTTKQEKINILKRFDGVETIKESKTLYKTIKDELSNSKGTEKTITESFERTVDRTPSSGSATNLIESKTYENPQFLRMKDLMSKI